MQDEIDSDSESESDELSEQEDTDSDMDDAAALEKAKLFAAAVKRDSKSSTAAAASGGDDTLAAALAELDMDHYDDSDDDDLDARRILGSGNPGMAFHRNPADDPYLTKHGSDSDSDSESEDLRIRDSDLLILAARNEEDMSHLEMWVYEEEDERGEGNLYVHHAVMLPAFPLSLAWIDVDPRGRKERGNYAAVGSFEPGIEIWDMDVLDAVEPVATLGGADYEAAKALAEQDEEGPTDSKSKKKKKKKKKQTKAPEIPVRPGSHEDAVLGLSWNRDYRNVLASASADKTVKVWDVATCTATHTLKYHRNKVQAVAWNPVEAPVLLSGGFDKLVCMGDMRTPEGEPATWEMPADVEAVSAENGEVLFYDARGGAGSAPLLRLAAHSKAASALAFSPGVKGLMLTASTDKKTKIWGVDAAAGAAPELLASQDLKIGAIFSASFCREMPLVLAAGGAKGAVAVWDTGNTESVAAWAQKQQE